MMSDQERSLLKAIQLTVIKWTVGVLLGALSISVGFYFSTTYDIRELKKEQTELKNGKADKEVIQVELKNINKSIDRIENKIDKIAK
jgi:peptidoglycan hydrolase CwlO-like protein